MFINKIEISYFMLNRMNPPLPHPPGKHLPSRRASVILVTLTLAAGVVLGTLIGPGPASSLASEARAAAVARVVALLALGQHTGAGSQLPLSARAGHSAAGTPHTAQATSANKAAIASASGHGSASGGQSETGLSTSSSPGRSPSSSSLSPTKSKSPPAGSGEAKPVRLPPIAHVWLIVLPYGQSFANTLGQPSSAPYLTGQLVGKGTLLSGYSSLAASELAGSATLLSGQTAASVSTIAPPCAGTQGAAGATGSAPSTTAAGAAPASPSATPCAASEPAGAQAADDFLREVVPQITASAEYKEGGLIAITFAAADADGSTPTAGSSTAGAPTAGLPTAGVPAAGLPTAPAIAYPAGTRSSTLTAAGSPGALLLSPFLRRPGARLASAFNSLAPRKSLEELVTTGSGAS